MIKRRLILEQDIAILINRDRENSLNSTSERKCAGGTEQFSPPRFTESHINVNQQAKSRNTIHIEKDGEGELYVEYFILHLQSFQAELLTGLNLVRDQRVWGKGEGGGAKQLKQTASKEDF